MVDANNALFPSFRNHLELTRIKDPARLTLIQISDLECEHDLHTSYKSEDFWIFLRSSLAGAKQFHFPEASRGHVAQIIAETPPRAR